MTTASKFTFNPRGVQKYLSMSTGHITKADNVLLTRAADFPTMLCIHTYEYGHFLVLSDDDAALAAKALGFSPEFVGIVRHAMEQGIALIQFDGVGSEHNLPTFDW